MSRKLEILYHYTCADHGAPGIEVDGFLRPNLHRRMPELGPVVWLTDMDSIPEPRTVGLTKTYLDCDRTAIRYVVFAADIPTLQWWPLARGNCNPEVVADLERYGWPTRWWLATDNVPVRRTA